jgi:hypothetical protein
METAECLVSLACVLLLSGCVSLQVAGQVQAGRQALLMNNPTQTHSMHFGIRLGRFSQK